jgi:hypothetical protein
MPLDINRYFWVELFGRSIPGFIKFFLHEIDLILWYFHSNRSDCDFFFF